MTAAAILDANALSPLPDGFVEVQRLRVSNAELAAMAGEPELARLIVRRRRIDGLEQDIACVAAPAGVSYHVNLALFAHDREAREEVDDPVAPAGFAAIHALRSAGSRSAFVPERLGCARGLAFGGESTTGGRYAALGFRFAVGRLVGLVVGFGPEEAAVCDGVAALALGLEAQMRRRPVRPVTARQLASLRAQASGESILFGAYTLLAGLHHRRPAPGTLLAAAYRGALALAAERAPDAELPAPGDPVPAWEQFIERYRSLARAVGAAVTEHELAHAAARRMYGGLDPHTAFLEPPAFRGFVASSGGERRPALGLTVCPRPPHVLLRVLPDSPAERSGLRAGDEVVALDGRPASQIAPLLGRGDGARRLALTVRRPGVAGPLAITVGPASEAPALARHSLLPSRIGHVQLDGLPRGDESVAALETALRRFTAAGALAWILDLRFNGGGWARTMCRVAGLFLPESTLMTSQRLLDGSERRQWSLGDPFPEQRPMVVLVGPATGSGAEVIAETLRASGRARIVGQPSAGAVNGGRHFAFMDGSGVRIAEFEFLVGPQRRVVENVGVHPDVIVGVASSDLARGRDCTLSTAECHLVDLINGNNSSSRALNRWVLHSRGIRNHNQRGREHGKQQGTE